MPSGQFFMKVLHVIPSLSPKHGGPSVALPLMARRLVAQGVQVDVATTDDDGLGCRMDVPLGQRSERDGYGVFHFRKQIEFYKVSLPFNRWLAAHVLDYDLVHIHALFSYASTSAARHAQRHKVPYIVRPLGVLNRWGMENRRRLVKSLSFQFVEKPILRHAAGMHYTSHDEQREAEAAGATAHPLVIPLGIDLAPFEQLPEAEHFFRQHPVARGRPLLLFLSRLDAKKGLDLLLPAFAKVRQAVPNALLVIVGDGPTDYVKSCHQIAADAGVAETVIWPGFLGGKDKLAAFAAASVFVLPSYSENFGIAAVEALAAGLPCVLASGVAVSADVAAGEAGLVVPPDSDSLAAALIQLLLDDAQREKFAGNARQLAASRFSLATMGEILAAAYREVLHEHY
jgi:glycosyltransferase involved in cell wall biosynthesis